MANVYLAVSPTYSASGVLYQGSVDANTGSSIGAAISCPGVFPVKISAKFKVSGTGHVNLSQVFCGDNHVLASGVVTDHIPNRGSVIRLESSDPFMAVGGGRYIDILNISNPGPPYSNGQEPSVSLEGFPPLFTGSAAGSVVLNGDSEDPSDPLNYYFKGYNQSSSYTAGVLKDGLHLFWSSVFETSSIALNLSASGSYFRLTSGSLDLRAVGYPQVKNTPTITSNQLVDQILGPRPPLSYRSASVSLVHGGNYADPVQLFGCLKSNELTAGGGRELRPLIQGTGTSSVTGVFNAIAVHKSPTSVGGDYVFATSRRINGKDLVDLGMFSSINETAPRGALFDIHFVTDPLDTYSLNSTGAAGLKPAFAINTALVNFSQNQGKSNSWWSGAFPQGSRQNEYSDVQDSRYGFIFLNKNTKHLEFLFEPHYDPGFITPSAQVINKIVHPPPRSADYIPAANMALGVDLKTFPLDVNIYSGALPAEFDADQIIHGGGGHVMALGTYNGAIVNSGKVAVWGSNRWGQCVLPEFLHSLASPIVDVAVSNAPPVLPNYDPQTTAGDAINFMHGVYSDELGEFLARDFYNSPFYTEDQFDARFYNAGTKYLSYSYPPILRDSGSPASCPIRYAGHINFQNLPGHILVVTKTGHVYAWGNNLYRQCDVPNEINLLNTNGSVKTADLTDPVMEVSAGAFHSVARTKSGVVYAWGAGRVDVTSSYAVLSGSGGVSRVHLGYQTTGNRTTPPTLDNGDESGPAAIGRRNVHFGQCVLSTQLETDSPTFYIQSGLGFVTPAQNPPGVAAAAINQDLANPPAAKIIAADVTYNGDKVGSKTPSNFAANEAGIPNIRCKGYISAGAFHTAVVDREFKIQATGAGKSIPSTSDDVQGTVFNSHDPNTVSIASRSHWGSSYSSNSALIPGPTYMYPNVYTCYPHYCQSMDQYKMPWPNTPTTGVSTTLPDLHRYTLDTSDGGKLKYFQDLRFKKVVCGPFTTHGIVYDVSRGASVNIYSVADRRHLHGRVVSWGMAHGVRGAIEHSTGPTGIVQVNGYTDAALFGGTGIVLRNITGYDGNPQHNPCGTISGMGSSWKCVGMSNFNTGGGGFGDIGAEGTPRMFELLNRPYGAPGSYSNSASLTNNVGYTFSTGCPVTISKFKVKDLASCGDYTIYAGYVDTLSQTCNQTFPGETQDTNGANAFRNQGTTYNYQASVFFAGPDYYYSNNPNQDPQGQGMDPRYQSPFSFYGRMHANNPFASPGRLSRNNRVGFPWIYGNETGLNINDKSLYHGPIKVDSGVDKALTTGSVNIKYVYPTTVFASNNMVCAAVGMDNRPTAWSGYFRPRVRKVEEFNPTYAAYYSNAIDLTLIPSVPISSFKAGTSHILAVTDGDWPVSKTLGNLTGPAVSSRDAQVPKMVSELGTRLFTAASATNDEVAPQLIRATTPGTFDTHFSKPVLMAWGAGDGREYGTTFLGFSFGLKGEPAYGSWFLDTHAITRYDVSYSGGSLIQNATRLPLGTGAEIESNLWQNYYGQYRWNVYGNYSGLYPLITGAESVVANDFGPELFLDSRSYGYASSAISLPPGHHLNEAMQSLIQFRQDLYPSTYGTIGLTGRSLLNGTAMAPAPVSFGRPWVDSPTLASGQALNRTVCCATAADEAQANYASINTRLEYHSPLNFARQSYTDYVVDYSAGDMHSGVLFSSVCPNYLEIQQGLHLQNLSNFTSKFMSGPSGEIPFGQRRVCKVALFGYGCEDQTAGSRRVLQDGNLAPIVPMLFARSSKVYCRNSYTLVTEPIRIVHTTTGVVSLPTAVDSGQSLAISAEQKSGRIRGMTATLKFTSSSATATELTLSNLTFRLSYKGRTYVMLGRVKANTNTAYLSVSSSTPVTVKVSHDLSPSKAYSLGAYSEAGLSPSSIPNSYTFESSKYYLKGIASAATIPALSKQGCYYPQSVNPATSAATEEVWAFSGTIVPFLPLDEAFQFEIVDSTGATYSGSPVSVECVIEIEVDALQVPYVVFGPSKAGVWNEDEELGPSYQADVNSYNASDPISLQVFTSSCPCELSQQVGSGPPVLDRLDVKSYPPDSRFICGTKKYGPSGNLEVYASRALTDYAQPVFPFTFRDALLKFPKISANFTTIFNTIPDDHRSTGSLGEQLADVGATLFTLPATAFIQVGQIINIEAALSAAALTVNSAKFMIDMHGGASAVLSINNALLYNKVLFGSVTASCVCGPANLGLILSLESGCE